MFGPPPPNHHGRKKSTLKSALSPGPNLNSTNVWGRPPPSSGSYPSSTGKGSRTPGSVEKGKHAAQSDIRANCKKPTKLTTDQMIDIVSKLQSKDFDKARGIEQFVEPPKTHKKNLFSSFTSCSTSSANNTMMSNNNRLNSSSRNTSVLSSTMTSTVPACNSKSSSNRGFDSRINTYTAPSEPDIEHDFECTNLPKHVLVAKKIVQDMEECDEIKKKKASLFVANKIEEGVPSAQIKQLVEKLTDLESALNKCLSRKDAIKVTAQSTTLLKDKYTAIVCPVETHEIYERFVKALNECCHLLSYSVEDLSEELNLHNKLLELFAIMSEVESHLKHEKYNTDQVTSVLESLKNMNIDFAIGEEQQQETETD